VVNGDVVPGEAEHTVPGQLEIRVGCGVPLAIASRPVVRESVELHDEAVRRPERVHLVGALIAMEPRVQPRRGQAGRAHELDVPVLELASRVQALPGGDRAPQPGRTSPAIGPRQDALHRPEVEALEALGPVDGAREVALTIAARSRSVRATVVVRISSSTVNSAGS
jgi:hypothetical protein